MAARSGTRHGLSFLAAALVLFYIGGPPPALASDNGLTGWLERIFPSAEGQVAATHGLTPYGSRVSRREGRVQKVVLVHGLDEPGRVWLNLAPALDRKGFSVWRFTYPNDQAIDDSSRFLFQCLKAAGWENASPVALVCHSMGGLVARQMLTDPDVGSGMGADSGYAGAAVRGRVPPVSHLIMIGTPNHGASLARFRILMEVREQVLNRIHGYGHWLQGFFDGDGAAGDQLVPGSKFLTRLNARPHPKGVSMAVIAGVLSPWLPPGDGLVSVTSARLEGLPFYKVPGNHLSMVRNMSGSSKRVPPAVPLVIRLLAE